MTSNSPLAYPAEYYYPEFLENPSDETPKPPPTRLSLTHGIDNRASASTKMPQAFKQSIEGADRYGRTTTRKEGSGTLAIDIVTNQGLPDVDITQAVQTDPKKNLLRDPTEKNMPRLIVDNSVLNQTGRTPRYPMGSMNDGSTHDQVDETGKKGKRASITSKSMINGDLSNGKSKTKTYDPKAAALKPQQQPKLQYIPEEPAIDDFWKKEVHIDEEGAVSIEPLHYDKAKYEGPFGLTRQAAIVYFIFMIVLTALGAIFLIITGVFYAQNFPDSTGNTGRIAGMGVCAFVFYFGLQMILIALWHQKYRQENPKKIVSQASLQNDSTTQLKTAMETNEQQFDYPYGQPIDYSAYGASYPATPYVANGNNQMLLQQPGGAIAAPYYDPVVWPSSVEVDGQLDPKFYQPMEMIYGQPISGDSLTVSPYPAAPMTTVDATQTTTKPKKKGSFTEHSKTVEPTPPKAKFDDLYPNSTVTDTNLPVLKKAPETNDLLRSIAGVEQTKSHIDAQGNLRDKDSKGKKKKDGGTDDSSADGQNPSHRHRRRHRHHRHHHRHRRSSYSPCSTCSDRSRSDYHSEVNVYPNLLVNPSDVVTGPTGRSRARTLSPTASTVRMNYNGKVVKDSGISVGLEDVPNVADDRLEQVPVVRRTIIVEPYPAPPTSKIVVKPSDGTGKKTKKKKKAAHHDPGRMEDIHLEDVHDEGSKGHASTLKKPRKNMK